MVKNIKLEKYTKGKSKFTNKFSKNYYNFDLKEKKLYKTTEYDLNNTNSWKLIYIYLKYRKTNKDLISLSDENKIFFEQRINHWIFSILKEKLVSDYKLEYKDYEIEEIISKFKKYNEKEIFTIITNLYDKFKSYKSIKTKENITYFCSNFYGFKTFTKHSFNEINNLTLVFLLKDENIDIISQSKMSNDRNRKYIVNQLNVLYKNLENTPLNFFLENYNKWTNKSVLANLWVYNNIQDI